MKQAPLPQQRILDFMGRSRNPPVSNGFSLSDAATVLGMFAEMLIHRCQYCAQAAVREYDGGYVCPACASTGVMNADGSKNMAHPLWSSTAASPLSEKGAPSRHQVAEAFTQSCASIAAHMEIKRQQVVDKVVLEALAQPANDELYARLNDNEDGWLKDESQSRGKTT